MEHIDNNLVNTYRFYTQYKKEMQSTPKHLKKIESVSKVISENGRFEMLRRWCDIETDWISDIEYGLEYIQKAIDENRQFIRTEGDVVPIERARRVSRDSTIHLAKHSELLSVQSNGSTKPERIFLKENMSNYAVYENKFLYMTICYLRDFVDIKYKAIIAVDNSYTIDLEINSAHSIKGKKISYNLEYGEKSTDDEYSSASPQNIKVLERIQNIRFAISAFLGTDLMAELSKVPMLKPPITPTNVLKMDNSFREVFALYTKVSSYKGLGYSINEERVYCSPITKKLSDDLAEVLLLNSFITCSFGSNIENGLDEALKLCLIEEHKRAIETNNEYFSKLKNEFGGDIDQYLNHLETYIKNIEEEKHFWMTVAEENDNFRKQIEYLNNANAENQIKLSETQKRLNDIEEENASALEKIKTEHNLEIQAITEKLTDEKNSIQSRYVEEIERIRQEEAEHQKVQAEAIEALKSELQEKSDELSRLAEENLIISAKYCAATGKHPTIDMSAVITEEAFDELEKEKAAFENYFENMWKNARKQIRKEILWTKEKKLHKNKKVKKEDTDEEQDIYDN